jgi:hypothetical protein
VEDLTAPSEQCSSQGYCLKGQESGLFGCSCISGYKGRKCEEVLPSREECLEESVDLTPTASTFTTTINGSIDACGNIHISITAPIEESFEESEFDFSAYTRIFFRDQDDCDYPEGFRTLWEDNSDPDSCLQTYESCTSFIDLLKCNGNVDPECYDSVSEEPLESCDPSDCLYPPCVKCFPGQVQVTRTYTKTTASHNYQDDASAENCHYFEVCLPWISEVESEIIVYKKPDVQNNMVLLKVAYNCFENPFGDCPKDKSWVIEILSVTNAPFMLSKRWR